MNSVFTVADVGLGKIDSRRVWLGNGQRSGINPMSYRACGLGEIWGLRDRRLIIEQFPHGRRSVDNEKY